MGGAAVVAARKRILVVDDDATSRRALAQVLNEEGYDAAEAADGEEAAGMLAAYHPELVLTDLAMPRLDGRGLVARLRAQLPGTPVIILTAQAALDARRAADRMGVEGFVNKPIHFEELLALVSELLPRA
jgi:DNA-binding response OmpR family regulator